MKNRLSVAVFWLVFTLLISHRLYSNEKNLETYNRYWVYGFEQSILKTCDGKLFWMWGPADFNGEYSMQGYNNPVTVEGYILPPDPQKNMNSTLPQLEPVRIKKISKPCEVSPDIGK